MRGNPTNIVLESSRRNAKVPSVAVAICVRGNRQERGVEHARPEPSTGPDHYRSRSATGGPHLLVYIHGDEAAIMAGLAALASDGRDLLLRAVRAPGLVRGLVTIGV
ncbi:hypothetical protein M8818_002861 [Zalaria obscura]|uniref:Uncharacterized protein n=1 Tax=Zalaria obscura TaxID=2024903 RepID=A0ACC3SK75_9PEZI